MDTLLSLLFFIALGVVIWWLYQQRATNIPVRAQVFQQQELEEIAQRPRVTLTATDDEGALVDANDPRVREVAEHPAFLEISPMLARGDWGGARRFLQKIAYGMPNATAEEKRLFTNVMKVFAEADPMYRLCMDAVRPLVEASPGIKQTALYPHMAAAPDAEHARYVLYFAHELGDIVRKKKGSSYTVFPKGTVV